MSLTPPRLMLFDLYNGGHNAQYLHHLAAYWVREGLSGRLDIVVSPTLIAQHPALSELAAEQQASGLRIFPAAEADQLGARDDLWQTLRDDRLHGRLLRRYVQLLRPDHVVLMYFDQAQLSLAFDLRFGTSLVLGGIYFRPSLHYDDLGIHAGTWQEKLKRFRKKVVLAAALRNPHLKYLFCLDPYAVPHVRSLQPDVNVASLPDGVTLTEATATRDAVWDRWQVPATRKVALLFGQLGARKGLHQVLDAAHLLPETAQRALCLVLAGPLLAPDRARALQQVAALQARTSVQVVVEERFVPDREAQALIRAADLVLLTYQQHVGSSNVLVRAAAEEVPVLGSDYGLVGAQIRRRKLGAVVDASSPEAVARALTAYLADPKGIPFDAAQARQFARENRAEAMAATFFRTLGMERQAAGTLPASPADE